MRPDPKASFALGLIAILLLVGAGIAFALDPDLFSGRVVWVARFENASSLGEGAPVMSGGVVVGRVGGIAWVAATKSYLAELRVDAAMALPRDGGVRIVESDPLRGAGIEILPANACEARTPPPEGSSDHAVATCRRLPGMLDTANDILRTANDIVGQIAGLVGQLKSSVAPAATDAAGEAAKTPSMASRAADIADNVGTLVKSVGALVDSLNRLQPDLQQTLATTRTLAGNTNDLVVRTLGIEESLRRDTLGRLNHTLEAADGMVRQSAPPLQQSLGDFRYMMGASSASIVRLVAQMDTITANLAEITRQLRDDPAALLHGRSLENPPGLAGRPR